MSLDSFVNKELFGSSHVGLLCTPSEILRLIDALTFFAENGGIKSLREGVLFCSLGDDLLSIIDTLKGMREAWRKEAQS